MTNLYDLEFDQDWSLYFGPLDKSIKERVSKKIAKILEYPEKKHLKKSEFFVDEVGQYRITYRIFRENKLVRFYFVGTHKDYEKWYKRDF